MPEFSKQLSVSAVGGVCYWMPSTTVREAVFTSFNGAGSQRLGAPAFAKKPGCGVVLSHNGGAGNSADFGIAWSEEAME